MSELTPQEFHASVHNLCLRNAIRAQRDCRVCIESGYRRPCVYCQPTVQMWRDKAKRYCWHEFLVSWTGDEWFHAPDSKCKICGTPFYIWEGSNPAMLKGDNKNPTYSDIESIKAVLVDVGEWERFLYWLYEDECPSVYTAFDILTTPGPFRFAAGTHIEGVE